MRIDPVQLFQYLENLGLSDKFTDPERWTADFGGGDNDNKVDEVKFGMELPKKGWLQFAFSKDNEDHKLKAAQNAWTGKEDEVICDGGACENEHVSIRPTTIWRLLPPSVDLAVIVKASFTPADGQARFYRFDGHFPLQKWGDLGEALLKRLM